MASSATLRGGRGSQSRYSTPSGRAPSATPDGNYLDEVEELENLDAPEQRRNEFAADDDTLSEVVMAVNMLNNSTVGCAYYVARTEKLYFMEDVRMGGPDIVEARA